MKLTKLPVKIDVGLCQIGFSGYSKNKLQQIADGLNRSLSAQHLEVDNIKNSNQSIDQVATCRLG